jgi:glycosyltransferase involved in cell wall biosynthesis
MSNVAFLCGGLQPGVDGVGDFSRSLAREVRALGRNASLVAWRDEHVCGFRRVAEGVQQELRFGADYEAERTLGNPDVRLVSLQFVPFSFDPKGLPSRAAAELLRFAPGARWHVMVHEPWSDGGRGGRLRRWAVQSLQRFSTRLMLRRLRPLRVHTSNARYAELLKGIGFDADILRIFGAIPLVGRRDSEVFRSLMPDVDGKDDPRPVLRLGVFGTLHPEWNPERKLEDLKWAASLAGRRLELVGVGGWGVAGETVWNRLEMVLGVKGVHLGRRAGEVVSDVLSNLDLALTSTPWEIVEKSSAVAAMLEHGVPVVVTRGDGAGRMREGIHFCDGLWGTKWIEVAAMRRPRHSGAAQAARQFCDEVLQHH